MAFEIVLLKSFVNQRFYILIGDGNSWNTSLQNNLWGFTKGSKGLWNTSQIGDSLAFYVTSPIKRIVGFGIIKKKFISEDIIWPDEKLFRKSIWKYKLEFEKIYVVDKWMNGISLPSNIILNSGRKVINKQLFDSFIFEAKNKWNKE